MKRRVNVMEAIQGKAMFCLFFAVLAVLIFHSPVHAGGTLYKVSGTKNYLALRTEMTYDTTNEIGRIYNGETVEVLNSCDNTYWYVYSSKLCRYGYVNRNYLTLANTCVKVNPSPCVNSFTVYGTKNYLAIRTDKTYDENNEIGRLYNGETVQLISTSDNSYWYVYALSLNRYGYVNSNYLR